jgi:transcriptional regulator with XRE-family HTH domain
MISAAELLRSARRRAGLSQRELARRARIPQPTIAAIERGRQDPRYRTLSRLLRACGVELDYAPVLGQGIDRTLITEQLRLSPVERLRQMPQEARFLRRLERARPR